MSGATSASIRPRAVTDRGRSTPLEAGRVGSASDVLVSLAMNVSSEVRDVFDSGSVWWDKPTGGLVESDDAGSQGGGDCCCAAVNAELVVDVDEVGLDGGFADVEGLADFSVGGPSAMTFEHGDL